MSRYEIEWPCCGDISITHSYEPSECPFCMPSLPPRMSQSAARYRWLRQWTVKASPMGGMALAGESLDEFIDAKLAEAGKEN